MQPLFHFHTLSRYQPSGEGGTRSPPAMPAKSKMAAWGPKNGRRGLERFLNTFFDPSTPSMRKGRDRGEKMGSEMMKIAATNVVASRERRPTGTPTARANNHQH